MAPQLHFLGKKLFLEHMLTKHGYKEHQGFLRSLLINKRFLNIANNHRIYKISVSPNSEERIHLRFKSYTERSSCCYGIFTFEFVFCVLKLLKPSFTEFDYGYMSYEGGCNADCLFTLMQLASASGKVRLYVEECEEEYFSNVLKRVYGYVDEFTCFNELLVRADKVKFKLLDKLEVFWIETNEQLNAVLKHPAKRLDLGFSLDDFDGELVQLHKNEARQCKLNIAYLEDVDQSYPIIQNVLNVCNQLETLDLNYESHFEDDVTDFATFLNEISQHYQMFTTLIEMIRQLSSNPKLNITFDFCQLWREIKTGFPKDWQQQIRQINGLQDAEIEETLKEECSRFRKKIKISSKAKNDHLTNAEFNFKI